LPRDYGRISPRFWTGDTGKKLRGNRGAQVLAAYLITCGSATMTGLYYLPLPVVSHETGLSAAEVESSITFLREIGFADYDHDRELVWVYGMASWQIEEELCEGDKRIKGVLKELSAFRGHRFVLEFWKRYQRPFNLGRMPAGIARKDLSSPLEAPLEALPSQDQDQEQEQEHDQSSPGPSERSAVTTAAGIVFPCDGPEKSWQLTRDLLAEWATAYPSLNLEAECRRALVWVKAKPARRKTARGMPAFLLAWFARTQDSGAPNRATGPPVKQAAVPVQATLAQRFQGAG
jgi:hypothetical protein